MRTNTVIILRGAPGSGKSTLATTLYEMAVMARRTAEVCSADQFFYDDDGSYQFSPELIPQAHQYCKNLFTQAVQAKVRFVIVDNTHGNETDFEYYMSFAKEHDYAVHVIVTENRHGGKSVHGVPDYAVQRTKYRIAQSLKL